MTTNELIAKLQELDPSGASTVQVAIHQSNKVYPIHYAPIENSIHMFDAYRPGIVRIYAYLPKGMHTITRKIS